MARIKPLRVYINVPESMAQDVTVGDSAELKFNEFPERTFAGKVLVLLLVVVLDQSAFSLAKRAQLSRNYFVQLV